MDGWLSSITNWLLALVKSIFSYLGDFIHDAFIWCLDAILGPLGDLVASIPAPSFMQSYSFGSLLSGLPPFALYVISNCNIGPALAVIGAGVVFNLARKILTLGQW